MKWDLPSYIVNNILIFDLLGIIKYWQTWLCGLAIYNSFRLVLRSSGFIMCTQKYVNSGKDFITVKPFSKTRLY